MTDNNIQNVRCKICPDMTGYILKWIDDVQFLAFITNGFGKEGALLCHRDNWDLL